MANRSIRCAALVWVAVAFAAPVALAHDFNLGNIHVDHPWSRATPKGASVGAGYMIVDNRGSVADRLVSVSSDVAGRVEIHEMAVVDGVMRMRPLPKGVELAPGMTARFEPGGLHVMFLDLRRPLEKGDRVEATLRFEKAGDAKVVFVVEAMGGGGEHRGH